jgi:tripartite ATP-independent transporter DctM subunit
MVFVILTLLALLGTPLFVVIAASAMLGYSSSEIPLSAIPIEIFGIAEMPILLAIPLFTFAGYILSESQAPARLVRLTDALTIIALGALLYPALEQAGYDKNFNLGLVTAAGSLGLLFAPSLPLILYGVVAELPIDDLFIAGVLPGILMMVVLSAYSLWMNRANRKPLSQFSVADLFRAIKDTLWEIPLPFVVLGGIYSGYFAVSEAAAVTAVYVVVVEVFIRRDIRIRKLPEIMRESMVLVGGILLILGVSLASTNYLIDAQVPEKLVSFVNQFVTGQTSFLLLLFLFLLVLGAILDIFSALVLIVPLILPVAAEFGVDPIHLGIVFLSTMQLGYLTPPVGLNLFISSYRFDQSIVRVYRATFPFLVMLMFSVLLITFWPALSLVLLKR